MSILGRFRIRRSKYTLRTMKLGDTGYIVTMNFKLSKKLLCIPLDTQVFKRIRDIELGIAYIMVHKVREGIHSDSYKLNLTEDSMFVCTDWKLIPKDIAFRYARDPDWVYFANPPISFEVIEDIVASESEDETVSEDEKYQLKHDISSDKTKKKLSLDELKQHLEVALMHEDYERATLLRDEIKKRKKEGK